jgi:hypothetical protein
VNLIVAQRVQRVEALVVGKKEDDMGMGDR